MAYENGNPDDMMNPTENKEHANMYHEGLQKIIASNDINEIKQIAQGMLSGYEEEGMEGDVMDERNSKFRETLGNTMVEKGV